MIVHLNPKLGDGKGLLQFDSCQLNFPKHPVVRKRGGTPFRQIFWSQNGAPANIVGHRWNANTEAFRQITSVTARTRDLASKISKKNFSGWHPGRPQREGATPSRTQPQHGYTPCAGAQAPPLLGPRSRKPFPQIKIYHYTPDANTEFYQETQGLRAGRCWWKLADESYCSRCRLWCRKLIPCVPKKVIPLTFCNNSRKSAPI